MGFGSALAVYFLFWIAAAFLMLPFGVKTDEEVGAARVPGSADSAPHRFDTRRHLLRATALGSVMFGLFYLNYVFGWITTDSLDFYN